MPAPVTRFAECESSVFISYAHADNEVYGNWVEDFARELKRDLAAELSRLKSNRSTLPQVHLSHLNGPVAGQLDQELKQRVARSFAMVIVVGRLYVSSEWCLNELRYFQETFGDEGLNTRLFVIALGDEPIKQAEQLPTWQQCLGGRAQVWQPFFEEGLQSHLPVPVLRDDGQAPTQAFIRRFDRLRSELVSRIKSDLATPQPSPHACKLLIGVGVPELNEAITRFADAARAHEPATVLLEPAALRRSSALAERLRDAERLVLPFNGAQPLFPDPAGGHLAVQLDTWRRLGKPDDQVFGLDLREVASADPAEPEHADYLAGLTLVKLAPAALLARLFPPPVPAAAEKAVAAAAPKPVRLFIESNLNEPSQWKPLGEQIRRRWQKLLDDRHIDVPLRLRPTGMNIDELGLFNLNDADGLILLWGQKEKQSLVSQINLVEDQLLDAAPAIVAYLSPPQPKSATAKPAMGWQVLRFGSAPPPVEVEPDAGDDVELNRFLSDVLIRASERHKLGPL